NGGRKVGEGAGRVRAHLRRVVACREHEQRVDARQGANQELHQRQCRGVRPMDVLENDRCRAIRSDFLQSCRYRCEELRSSRGVRFDKEVVCAGSQYGAQRLAPRPIGRRFAVGAPAPPDQAFMVGGEIGDRFGQSGLADAGVAEEHDAAPPPGARVRQQRLERREFEISTDQRGHALTVTPASSAGTRLMVQLTSTAPSFTTALVASQGNSGPRGIRNLIGSLSPPKDIDPSVICTVAPTSTPAALTVTRPGWKVTRVPAKREISVSVSSAVTVPLLSPVSWTC